MRTEHRVALKCVNSINGMRVPRKILTGSHVFDQRTSAMLVRCGTHTAILVIISALGRAQRRRGSVFAVEFAFSVCFHACANAIHYIKPL